MAMVWSSTGRPVGQWAPAPPPPPPPPPPPEKPPPPPELAGGENAEAVADPRPDANEPIEPRPEKPSPPWKAAFVPYHAANPEDGSVTCGTLSRRPSTSSSATPRATA